MSDKVKIVEVGPRDGLQNEKITLDAKTRAALITQLADCGLTEIEAGAFVSPKWVPQMSDSANVLAMLAERAGVSYPVLVPNMKGYEAAKNAGARRIAVFGAASETFSQKNINATIAQSLERFEPVVKAAQEDGISVRGYVSCVLGCPYEGPVAVSAVVDVAARLYELGCDEISLGDTIGVGTPYQARAMLKAVAGAVPMQKLACHFHDTYGQALANLLASIEEGCRTIDSSVSGLGGCPYAKGASGNVATEDVLYLLEGLGFETGIDRNRLIAVSWWIAEKLGRTPGSKLAKAIGGPAS